jgi:hypothetical protein
MRTVSILPCIDILHIIIPFLLNPIFDKRLTDCEVLISQGVHAGDHVAAEQQRPSESRDDGPNPGDRRIDHV